MIFRGQIFVPLWHEIIAISYITVFLSLLILYQTDRMFNYEPSLLNHLDLHYSIVKLLVLALVLSPDMA